MAQTLTFIVGRGGSGKTRSCMAHIAEAVRRDPLGDPLLLIVPEHMTYTMERELARELPGGGTLRAQAVGFRRLAYRLLTEVGGSSPGSASERPLSDLGKRVLLKKLLQRRGRKAGDEALKFYARAAEQRGFSATLAEMFAELKAYAVTPGQLAATRDMLGEGVLAHKLHDLALLYGDYLAATRGRFADSDDRMGQLAALIPQSKWLRGADVWVDGFIFFTPVERRVLGALLRSARSLAVTLPWDADDAALFSRATQTRQQLIDLARECGAGTRTAKLETVRRYAAASALGALERHLFELRPAPPEHEVEPAGLKLIEAATRRLELDAVAADIVRLCRDEGYRYRDIGVIVRDAEHYIQPLEFVLAEHGVPCFSDVKRAAVHHPLAELVRSALEVIDSRWSYESVFRCVKTGLLPTTMDEGDRLENFVRARGLRGEKAWSREWTADGLPAEEVAALNATRRLVAEPLATLTARFSAAKRATVREYATALHGYLMDLGAPERLAAWSEEARGRGDLALADEHRRMWREFCDLLDQLVDLGDLDLPGGNGEEETMSAEDFAALLNDALDAMQLALVPPKADAVTVALFDQNSLNNVRALYILGANEGVLPRRIPERSLLTDAERLKLCEAHLTLAPSKLEDAANESYMLYHEFTLPRERLCVSWSLADSEGAGLGRSSVVDRLRTIVPKLRVDFVALEGMEKRPELLCAVGSRAVARLAPALREFRARGCAADGDSPCWAPVYNWAAANAATRERLAKIVSGVFDTQPERRLDKELARRLYLGAGKRLRTSVSRVESFNACPFKHFAQYGLRLAPREEHQFTAADFGSLLHQVMQEVGARLKRAGARWRDLDEAARRELCGKILAEQVPQVQGAILMSSAQYRHLAERVGETAEAALEHLTDFARQTKFEPRMFEAAFGSDTPEGEILTLPIDGATELELRGKIDRVDTAMLINDHSEFTRYYLVIDYKTGNTGLTLDEVYYGLKLQLLTYALAASKMLAKRGEPARPAGVLYWLLKNPTLSFGKKAGAEEAAKLLNESLRLEGWLLDDVAVIRSLDAEHQFVKVSLTAGGISGRNSSRVKSAAQLDLLFRYAARCVQHTAKEIVDGTIGAHPFRSGQRNACSPFCQYQAVCGFDLKLGHSWNELQKNDKERLEQMSDALSRDEKEERS